MIVAAGGRAVLKFGAGCAATVRARGQLIGEEGGGWEQPGPEYSGACYFLGRSSTADWRPRSDPRIVEIGCRMPANQAVELAALSSDSSHSAGGSFSCRSA